MNKLRPATLKLFNINPFPLTNHLKVWKRENTIGKWCNSEPKDFQNFVARRRRSR